MLINSDKIKGGVMNRIILAAILLCEILSGCTTIWNKQGSSQQDFYRDNSRCQMQSGQACGHGEYSWICKGNIYDSCMFGEGWQKQ
jgi:uncharacterized protein YceK